MRTLLVTLAAVLAVGLTGPAAHADSIPAADRHKAGITQKWYRWDRSKSVEFVAKPGHAKRIKVWFNDYDRWGAFGGDDVDGWNCLGKVRVTHRGTVITSWDVDVKRRAPTRIFRWKVVH